MEVEYGQAVALPSTRAPGLSDTELKMPAERILHRIGAELLLRHDRSVQTIKASLLIIRGFQLFERRDVVVQQISLVLPVRDV